MGLAQLVERRVWDAKAAGSRPASHILLLFTLYNTIVYMKITKKRLEKIGFIYEDLGDKLPYDQWNYKGLKIWDYNGKFWICDALDQAGIDVELKTMEHLFELLHALRLYPQG